ncbi:MAG: glycosyltransferase family 87 protein [Pseudoxanthomonas sp.]
MTLLLTVLVALSTGQDRNWDLRNYHLYTPSALLSGRLSDDIAVAQLQTWHNPTADIPFAWMVHAGWPGWLVSLWLAVPAFLAVFFAVRIMDHCWPAQRGRLRTWMAALTALTGAAVGPTVGSTFNDAIVAAGALIALWWVIDSQDRRGIWARWVPAGLMLGLATGLKLTGIIYCGALAAVALIGGSWRGAPLRVLAVAFGGVAGGVLTAGPWAWTLWQEHGNPLFPYFNQLFQSPDALAQPYNDTKFIPHGADAWLVLAHLLSGSRRFSESTLADARLLLGLASLLLAVCVVARRHDADPCTRRPFTILMVFAVVSFGAWTVMYGIYRYLYALEALCSVAIVATVFAHWPRRWPRYTLVLALLALVGLTNRPGWGRDHRFTTPMIQVQFPALPAQAMVITSTGHPVAHAAAFLPRNVPAISVANNFMRPETCTRLQARAEQRIRTHAGPFFLLRERENQEFDPVADAYRHYGLELTGQCSPVPDSLRSIELCALQMARQTPTLCPSSPADR